MASVPSQAVLKKPRSWEMSSRRATTGAPSLRISIVTRLGSWSRMFTRAVSRRPSSFGLKRTVAWKRVTIGGGVGNANGSRKMPRVTTNSTSMVVATTARRVRSRPSAGALVI